MLQKINKVITEATAPTKAKRRYIDISDVIPDKGMVDFLDVIKYSIDKKRMGAANTLVIHTLKQ
jgi:hypothetical protein